jgi:uncharacterized protein DUF2855
VLLSSASSKTASAIAFLLASRGSAVIGLTSPRNEPFVRGLGVYDEVAAYDAIDALPRRATAFIDVAGDERVRDHVHKHFRDDLTFSGFVGATHLDADVARAWARYVAWSEGWLTVRRAAGPEAVRAAFLDVLGGRVASNEAHLASMHSPL